MQKVVALLAAISILPFTFAQTAPILNTSGTFSGEVLPRCTVFIGLGSATLEPSEDGVDTEGFVTDLDARGQYEFLSNSGCTATVEEDYTATPDNGNGACAFDDGSDEYTVESAVFKTSSNRVVGVNATVTATEDFLLAGNYKVVCSVNLEAF